MVIAEVVLLIIGLIILYRAIIWLIYKIVNILMAKFLNFIGKIICILLVLVAFFIGFPYSAVIGVFLFILFRNMKRT